MLVKRGTTGYKCVFRHIGYHVPACKDVSYMSNFFTKLRYVARRKHASGMLLLWRVFLEYTAEIKKLYVMWFFLILVGPFGISCHLETNNFNKCNQHTLWLNSHISLASLYWYVAEWEIWRKLITGHMVVTRYHALVVQWQLRYGDYVMILIWCFFAGNWID